GDVRQNPRRIKRATSLSKVQDVRKQSRHGRDFKEAGRSAGRRTPDDCRREGPLDNYEGPPKGGDAQTSTNSPLIPPIATSSRFRLPFSPPLTPGQPPVA